jgi:NADH:ubiquinone oxidoreductase subunit K
MKVNLNTLAIGLIMGLAAPLINFLGFYLLKYTHVQLIEFIDFLIRRNVIIQIISLCVIANLGIFFLFIQTHRYYSARGVIMATFIYAIGAIIFKFI